MKKHMRKFASLTDKELVYKLEKVNEKISKYALLIWLAALFGTILLVVVGVSLLTNMPWLAKSCGIVAGIQSFNTCMFLGIAFKLEDKKNLLLEEQKLREKMQAQISQRENTKSVSVEITFEKTKTKEEANENNNDLNSSL